MRRSEFVDGHQIDLRAGLVPESLNSMGNRKIPDPLAAALLVELAGEFLQAPRPRPRPGAGRLLRSGRREAETQWPKPDSPRPQARTEKIIGHVIAAALRFRLGKHRQLSLDQSEPLDQHLQVAANLGVRAPARLANRLHEFVVHPPRIAGHELQDHVIAAAQLREETSFRPRTEGAMNFRKRCGEAKPCVARPSTSCS